MPGKQIPKLTGAVGQNPRPHGKKPVKNKPEDVKLVQNLLCAAGFKVNVSGKCDAATLKAIMKFQKAKAGFRHPDGVIDVGMKTYKALVKHGGPKLTVEAPRKKIRISYTVPIIAQPPNTMSCWATAIAMMLGWKKSMSFDPKTIADELGYTTQFKTGGLHPEDRKVFKHWGLGWETPMCYSVQGLADLLKARGPLWIAGNPNSPHVRVITGIKSDGTPKNTKLSINDPGGGKRYTKTFEQVMGKMEDLGAAEFKLKKPVYLAHF